MAWQITSNGEGVATESIQEDVVKSSSVEPAPPQLPPPRKDMPFRYPSYRVESTTRPSHAAGICNDVPEYILPEETSNKNYTRASDAREASNTCHTSSRYYSLTIPGAICSPPPTPPLPPSTPLPRRWVESNINHVDEIANTHMDAQNNPTHGPLYEMNTRGHELPVRPRAAWESRGHPKMRDVELPREPMTISETRVRS